MLKVLVLGLAAGMVLAGSAIAQPLPPRSIETGLQPLLIKHDKDNGHGRKLGHYKHHGDDDWRWSSSRRGSYARDWPYSTSPRFYGAPGYGSSLPPAYYAPPGYYGLPY